MAGDREGEGDRRGMPMLVARRRGLFLLLVRHQETVHLTEVGGAGCREPHSRLLKISMSNIDKEICSDYHNLNL